MSFASDIYTVMIGDSSLNGLVDDGIHYQNLKAEWNPDLEDDEAVVVYDQFKAEQQDCLDSKNVFMTYTLNVVAIQKGSNDKIDTITDRIIAYLNNYESGNIIDIGFVRDQGGFNQQEDIYTNELEFRAIYIES